MSNFQSSVEERSACIIDNTVEKARQAVVANPDDDKLRLYFAEVLRQAGSEAQAVFIETQLGRPSATVEEPSDPERPHPEWTGFDVQALPAGIQWAFRKGFVEHLICSADEFLTVDQRLSAITPIKHLTLLKFGNADISALLRSSTFRNLRSLSMDSCGLDDTTVGRFASVKLHHLAWLSLAYNQITLDGVTSLACATALGRFPRLRFVSLLGCPSDPREQLFYDQGAWVNSYLPKEGANLLAQFGKCDYHSIPWLFLASDGKPRDVNRFRVSETEANDDANACQGARPRVPAARRSSVGSSNSPTH